MAKKLISIIIIVTHLVTSTAKDSFALRPIAYKMHTAQSVRAKAKQYFLRRSAKQAYSYKVRGIEVNYLLDEVEAAVDSLLDELPDRADIKPEQRVELMKRICKSIRFVSPGFFHKSYSMLKFLPFYLLFMPFSILAALYLVFTNLPAIGMILTPLLFLSFYFKFISTGRGLKGIPSYLAQIPTLTHWSSLPFILYGLCVLAWNLTRLLPLLFLYWYFVYHQPRSNDPAHKNKIDKRGLNLMSSHFWKETLSVLEKEQEETALMLEAARGMHFSGWQRLYLRAGISRKDFRSIVSHLLTSGIMPSEIDFTKVPERLTGLFKRKILDGVEDISEDIYIFYHHNGEEGNKDSSVWYPANVEKWLNGGRDTIRHDLVGETPQKSSSAGDRGSIAELDEQVKERLYEKGSGAAFWSFMGTIFSHYRNDFQFALINKCPVPCEHCIAFEWMKGPREELEYEIVKEAIDCLIGTKEIGLTGGEPTLWKNTYENLINGRFSKELLALLNYAKELGINVVISTSGLWVPAEGITDEELSEQKIRELTGVFEQLPDNVILELSLDEEHTNGLLQLKPDGRRLKDIVKAAEVVWKEKMGRDLRYNIRAKAHDVILQREDTVEEALEQWDYKERIWKRYKSEKFKEKELRTIRVSRTKLQSKAAKRFDIGEPEKYTPMNIKNFAENFLPGGSLPCISHNATVTFDPHSLFMPNPPPIARLGVLGKGRNLTELMFDEIIGRWVNFEKYPFLRYLFLACYLQYIDDEALASRCLDVAREMGSEYEKRYQEVTGGATFDIIYKQLEDERRPKKGLPEHFKSNELEKLYYVGSLVNLLTADEPPAQLRSIIPDDLPAVWDCLALERFLENYVMRNFVEDCSKKGIGESGRTKLDLLIENSVQNIIGIVRKGHNFKYGTVLVIDDDYIPSFQFSGEAPTEKLGVEYGVDKFRDFSRNKLKVYFGRHAERFFFVLRQELKRLLREEKTLGSDAEEIARAYLGICREQLSVLSFGFQEDIVDDISWFMGFLHDKYNNAIYQSGTRRLAYEARFIEHDHEVLADLKAKFKGLDEPPEVVVGEETIRTMHQVSLPHVPLITKFGLYATPEHSGMILYSRDPDSRRPDIGTRLEVLLILDIPKHLISLKKWQVRLKAQEAPAGLPPDMGSELREMLRQIKGKSDLLEHEFAKKRVSWDWKELKKTAAWLRCILLSEESGKLVRIDPSFINVEATLAVNKGHIDNYLFAKLKRYLMNIQDSPGETDPKSSSAGIALAPVLLELEEPIEILKPYFKDPEQLTLALSLYGDIIIHEPEKRKFLQKILFAMQKQKKGRDFNSEDMRDILDWIIGGSSAKSMFIAMSEFNITYDALSERDDFIRRIVTFRIPKMYFKEAFLIHCKCLDSKPALSGDQFIRRYEEAIKDADKNQNPIIYEENIPNKSYYFVLPSMDGAMFEILVPKQGSYGGCSSIFFRLRDKALIENMRHSGFFPNFTPYFYFFAIIKTGNSICVVTHQPIIRSTPGMAAAAPEVYEFLQEAPTLCMEALKRRVDEINKGIWPEGAEGIENILLPSTGFMTHWWRTINAASAIRYYTTFPIAQGFNLSTATADEKKGFGNYCGSIVWRSAHRGIATQSPACDLRKKSLSLDTIDSAA